MIKLLVTDLDDTLYSWLEFFVPSFYTMVDKLLTVVDVDKEELLKEYKSIHQRLGSLEYPYSTLELPCIKSKYPNINKENIPTEIKDCFEVFNHKRNEHLKLYEGVEDFLRCLKDNNIKIVAYSESGEENGVYRVNKLGIEKYFDKIFIKKSPYDLRGKYPNNDKVITFEGFKPNIGVLERIIKEAGVKSDEVIYIGDHLYKDMLMAKRCNVKCGLVDLNSNYVKGLVKEIIPISNYDDEHLNQLEEYKKEWNENNYKPDYEIKSYKEFQKVLKIK